MIITITPNDKCKEYIETFKSKLNSVLFNLKHSLELQLTIDRNKDLEEKYYITERKENYIKERHPSDVKKYFEIMDPIYERNILKKISPIKNSRGKYVVDLEKVLRDLILVKESLYSIFNNTEKLFKGTNCKILEEFSRAQREGNISERILGNIANQYRILLNTIMRFSVEARWLMKEKIHKGKLNKMEVNENEELMKLKLMNNELKEKLTNAEEEINRQQRQLALFVGDESSL